MKDLKNVYDDGNIPEIDLPRDAGITHAQNKESDSRYCQNENSESSAGTQDSTGIQDSTDARNNTSGQDSTDARNRVVTPVEPLPESSRPRKDGPGGN